MTENIEVNCNHLWEKNLDPLRLICGKCGKVFDVDDPDDVASFGNDWAISMAEALAREFMKQR